MNPWDNLTPKEAFYRGVGFGMAKKEAEMDRALQRRIAAIDLAKVQLGSLSEGSNPWKAEKDAIDVVLARLKSVGL